MSNTGYLILFLIVLGFAIAGTVLGCLTARLPMSGKLALALLVIPVACLSSGNLEHRGQIGEWLSMFFFALSAPVCVLYSFHARQRAPDRRLALAAFVGAIVMALFFVLVVVSACVGIRLASVQ